MADKKKRGHTKPIAFSWSDNKRTRGEDKADREQTTPERDRAVTLACKYRDRVVDLLKAEIGLMRPGDRDGAIAEHFAVAECQVAEGLASIIEQHLTRKAIRRANETKRSVIPADNKTQGK